MKKHSNPAYIVNGGKPLHGSVKVSGAKNAATKQLVASLLTDDEVKLTNVPQIGDVDATIELLQGLGVKVVQRKMSSQSTPKELRMAMWLPPSVARIVYRFYSLARFYIALAKLASQRRGVVK